MTAEDQSTMKVVRGVLVRNYVDTHKLKSDVVHNSVYLDGELALADAAFYGHKDDRIEQDGAARRVLQEVEREIKRMTSAKAIYFKLTNWERIGQRWARKGKGEQLSRRL